MTGPERPLFDVEEMEVSFGPQHPATHGVLRVQMKLDGERIVEAKPIIGYLHRGTEKLFETMAFPACLPHTDRMDYVNAAHNNQGFCVTMEKLLGITIPPRAAYIRMILAEMQRLASHLVWLATHAVDIGAITPFFYTFRERDAILDLFEEYCGARLTLNCMKIGGVPYDLESDWLERCSQFIESFPAHVDEYETLLTNNRIWKKRTVGVGVISPEDAIEMGMTGPPLRGSGVEWDIRKVFPYDRYDEIDFVVPIGKNCDTYDRYLVRIEEMRQSVRILRQCLDTPAGRPDHGQGAEDPAYERGHGLRLGRESEGGARLLHRRNRKGHRALPVPGEAGVFRQPSGPAADGGGLRSSLISWR